MANSKKFFFNNYFKPFNVEELANCLKDSLTTEGLGDVNETLEEVIPIFSVQKFTYVNPFTMVLVAFQTISNRE